MSEQAPLPQDLPEEIWATWNPTRSTVTALKMHNKRGFALNSLTQENDSNYSNRLRRSVMHTSWYDKGYRLYLLETGGYWQDVSEQYRPETEEWNEGDDD